MSRFSPGGLLGGHHPGLSPASGQGGHHHLPHIKQDLDAVSSGNHHHGSSHSGRAEKECKFFFKKNYDILAKNQILFKI